MLHGGVSREDGVIRLDYSHSNLGSGVDGELQFALLTVVGGKAFHQERCEAGPGTTTKGAEHMHKPLQAHTLLCDLTKTICCLIDHRHSDGVVPSSSVYLLAASSLPEMSCSGWNSWWEAPVRTSSTTDGSRSAYIARGTYFPAPVSLKNVLKESFLDTVPVGSKPSG